MGLALTIGLAVAFVVMIRTAVARRRARWLELGAAQSLAGRAGTQVVEDLEVDAFDWDLSLRRLIGADTILAHEILPRRALPDGSLSVLLANPLDHVRRSAFETATGRKIGEALVATPADLRAALALVAERARLGLDEQGPSEMLACRIVEDAYARGASDVHVEGTGRVRYRVDGELEERLVLPDGASRDLVERYETMAGLPGLPGAPRHGRIEFRGFSRTGLDLDLALATWPTATGPSAVLRLLVKGSVSLGLDALGIAPENEAALRESLAAKTGVIVFAGPTGSGKTTTLYSAAQALLARKTGSTLVLMDDHCYPLEGATAIASGPGTEAEALLLASRRLDTDFVVVTPELRDRALARAAFDVALDGRLVLVAVSAASAGAAVERLLELGVDASVVRGTLRAVVCQRLARRLCKECKAAQDDTNEPFRARRGTCARCDGSGYKGRLAVHELLVADDAVRALVRPGVEARILDQELVRQGRKTMAEDARAKVAQGLTDRAAVA